MNHSFTRASTLATLDIGSSKVCCLIAHITPRDKKIEIVGYGYNASKGIKNGVITDINQATLSVCNAVEDAEQQAKERIKQNAIDYKILENAENHGKKFAYLVEQPFPSN